MNSTPEQLAATIAVLDAQRAILGDDVVDTALAPLRRELAALTGRALQTAQQLKQVSVVFVDVVGSTSMGQQLSPEEIHAVMDGALERFTLIVQSHHGRVLQYTGDGMLAAFGSEEASEDDVESAIRAGLDIIEEARRQAPQVRQRHGVPDFNVRAGVHTGTVLLGGGVDADGSIRGATVNVAARMEQSAPPGRLRISHDSYRHVRGLFEVTEQDPIRVKGVEQPLRSYLVDRVKPRAFRVPNRGVEGVYTEMVGREAELEVLQAAFRAAVTARRAHVVTVVGDAGLGKSRLLAEFLQTLNMQTCWLLLARAHPRSALQPYGMLREMLARQLQIGESDSPELGRRKLVDGLTPLLGEKGEARIHLLGHLIGLDFSTSPHVQALLGEQQQLRDRAFAGAAMCLQRLSESKPVVIVLDDIHWADAGSLDFMRHLSNANRATPVLSLMLTRPTLFEQSVDWIDAGPDDSRIDLKPLDRAFSGELAEVLLQRLTAVPAALRALLIGGAEGNPFYMEELVKMLIDDGVIVAEAAGWSVVPHKLIEAHVPPTLTGVLEARLDALAPGERLALQQAAVVGHVFWDEALAAISPLAVETLPVLLRKQLIVRRDATAFDDTSEFAFQHNLLHQVAYDSVLKGPKHAAHAKVGDFWSGRAEVGAPQHVNPAACRALAEAQHHRCRCDARAYVEWFDGQFYNYLNAYAGHALRPLAEQLIDICESQFGPDHPETAKALTNLARVMLVQGGVEKAEPLLRRAIRIQEHSLDLDHADTARTLAVLGGYFQGRGDLKAAEPFFRRSLDIRERMLGPEHPLTLSTLDNLAKATLELGRLDEAERLSRLVLAARERSCGVEHPDTAYSMIAVGEILTKKREFGAAEPLLRRALAVQQQHLPEGSPDTGLSMWHLAELLRGLQRVDEAEPLARRALEIWESSFGLEHEWTAWGLISLAEIRLQQGAAVEAATGAERAAQILQKVFGEQHAVLASTLGLQGRALLALGENRAAEATLARALAIQTELASAASPAATATALLLDLAREHMPLV